MTGEPPFLILGDTAGSGAIEEKGILLGRIYCIDIIFILQIFRICINPMVVEITNGSAYIPVVKDSNACFPIIMFPIYSSMQNISLY